MPEADRQLLVDTLRAHYEKLLARLARYLQSTDLATAALHDVWLRLEQGPEIGIVAQPRAYLYRMAINAARNQRKRNRDLLGASEIAELINAPDEAPGPDREVQARLDLNTVIAALDALPRPRRDIFLASWLDRKTQAEIAAEFGVHKRTVQKEIDRARKYLLQFFSDDDEIATAFRVDDVS